MTSLDTQVFLNPEQVVGNVVPTVYIDRIVLEGGGDILKQTNPHIDWEGEGSGLDFAGAPASNSDPSLMTQLEKRERATRMMSKEHSDNLTVTLNLTVKDVATNKSYSWFNDIGLDIKRYIKVYVVQTTNPSATERWSQFYDVDTLPNENEPSQPMHGTSIKTFYLNDLLGPSPDDQSEGEGVELPRHYIEVDSNGTKILNITKVITSNDDGWIAQRRQTQKPLPKNPKHLAYFVYGEFDLKSLMTDFNSKADRLLGFIKKSKVINIIGKVSSDVVIQDGKTIAGAYVYLTKDNDLWTGDVHYMADANPPHWMGGKKHTTGQPILKRQLVQNNKIQDFRLTEKIEKLNLDFSILENKLLKQITGNPRVNSDIVKRKVSYFTDLFLSRNKQGDCEFFFGIDFQKVIRENSPYGRIFLENVDIYQVLKQTKILSMKIFRVRVGGSSEAGSNPYRLSRPLNGTIPNFDPFTKPKRFNYDGITNNGVNYTRIVPLDSPQSSVDMKVFDQTNELILIASETFSGKLSFHAFDGVSSIAALPQIYTKGIQQANPLTSDFVWIPTEEGPVEYFTGVDASMKDLTDGYYQYRVELEIEDASVNFLTQKRQVLSDAKKKLNEYYKIGSKVGITSIGRIFADREKMTMEEDVLTSGKVENANFDPVANRFTQNFIRKMSAKYPDPQTAPWNEVPNTYLETLAIFVDLAGKEQEEIKQAFMNYTNPISGNLKGIKTLLDLIDQLESILSRGIGITMSTDAGNFTNPKSTKSSDGSQADVSKSGIQKQGPPPIKKFKIERHFDAIFNANIPKFYGVSYLPPTCDDPQACPTGISQISVKDFRDRTKREVNRYFSNETAAISVGDQTILASEGAMGYFSPATIRTENTGEVNLLSEEGPIADHTYVQIGIDSCWASIGRSSPHPQYPKTQGQDAAMTKFWNTLPEGSPVSNNMPVANNIRSLFAEVFSCEAISVSEVDREEPIFKPGEILDDINDVSDEDPAVQAYLSWWGSSELGAAAFSHLATSTIALPIFMSLMADLLATSDVAGEIAAGRLSWRAALSSYDPNNPAGFFANQPITSEMLRNLPRPILALVAAAGGGDGASAVPDISQTMNSTMFSTLQGGLLTNPMQGFKANILFKSIVKCEVLVGYKTVKYGKKDGQNKNIVERSVKMPVWEKCNQTMLNDAQNRYLLCRLSSWQDVSLGANSTSPKIPFYNQYFLIRGGNVTDVGSVVARHLPAHLRSGTELLNSKKITNSPSLSMKLNNPQYQSWNPYISGENNSGD